jgi:hypothetical protein
MDTWIRLGVWTAIGIVIFFGYSVWRAKPARFTIEDAA